MNTPSPAPSVITLPDEIPVFPLSGVLLLPHGHLPLNIFEPRYLSMVDDALKSHQLIGMIQPREDGSLFTTGCAGKITAFSETDDGRYEITLKGLSRFVIGLELPNALGGYRRVRANWSEFPKDTDPVDHLNLDRNRLKDLLRNYFDIEGMDCEWSAMETVSDDNLITCLSMVCPLDASEKQALLEARCGNTRSELFMTLLEMATRDTSREHPGKGVCH
ncbi:MAG: ATP-dependent protease La domain protein [Micavibrio sp.]|nr:ATP-dependent protease La domain protein [Micavibrio sp.]